MKQKFQRVILYARQHRVNSRVGESLQRLMTFLHERQIEVVVDQDTATVVATGLPVLPRKEMGKSQDLMVVVGGDGSLLSAARMAISVDVPVIGINRGQLGFLTDISPSDIETQLGAVLDGDYREEQRFLLKASIYDDNGIYFQSNALNDVVLSRGDVTHLVDFEISINQQFVSHYRADGVIFATPTGSTAYALSAGGPIMHPSINAIVLVPMFSHSLSSRSVVVDGQSIIEVLVTESNESQLRVSCDGHESQMIKPGQRLAVEKNAQHLRLLHPSDYHYYDTLRIKLGWEARHHQGNSAC